MFEIDERYLIKVKDLPEPLPAPRLRRPKKKEEDRAETLEELPIISVRCELNEI